MLKQRQDAVDDHHAGRRLLEDKELARHQHHIKGIHRKLAGIRNKDPKEKMMAGEFNWTPEGLVLKDP
eukprot:scaffold1059_cov196-Alexandrium_tamarense.AAC.8